MKNIRITTAKTRQGILNWLAKFNSASQIKALDHSAAVAVSVYRDNGEIRAWIMPNGQEIPASHAAAFAIAA